MAKATDDATKSPTRREIIAEFVPASPFVQHLGMKLAELEPDRAELTLEFDDSLATVGDVIHGGAIASLIDTAAMAAAWSDDAVPPAPSGGTVSMSVDYVAAARGRDLKATATVVGRGRSLCFCEVEVTEPEDGIVAKGLVTHRFGG